MYQILRPSGKNPIRPPRRSPGVSMSLRLSGSGRDEEHLRAPAMPESANFPSAESAHA